MSAVGCCVCDYSWWLAAQVQLIPLINHLLCKPLIYCVCCLPLLLTYCVMTVPRCSTSLTSWFLSIWGGHQANSSNSLEAPLVNRQRCTDFGDSVDLLQWFWWPNRPLPHNRERWQSDGRGPDDVAWMEGAAGTVELTAVVVEDRQRWCWGRNAGE